VAEDALTQKWHKVQVDTAIELTKLYVNSGDSDVGEKAMGLVLGAWATAMEQLNPGLQEHLDSRTFSELTIEEKLELAFDAPHPPLTQFALIVRRAAAVGQKVA